MNKINKSNYAGNSTTENEDILLKYLSIEETRELSAKIRERNLIKFPETGERLSGTLDEFIQAIEHAHSSEPVVEFSIDKDLEKEIQKAFELAKEETKNQEEVIPSHEELEELLEATLLKIDEEIADLKNAT